MSDATNGGGAAAKRSNPSRLWTLKGVQVLATGSHAPDQVVSNEQLAERLGFDADWIVQRTGIRQRRHAAAGEASSHIATEAARRCLEHAECPPDDVDLLLLATSTPDYICPATANLVQERLGLRCGAADMMAACAGFMYAMVTGMQYVANGCSRRALVIGVDTMSRVLNPAEQHTYPLFGDGGGAVLLAPGSDEQGLDAFTLGSDGSGEELLTVKMGGSMIPPSTAGIEEGLQYLKMDGRAVFKWAVQLLAEQVPAVLDHARVRMEDIDLMVLHQANLRIVHAVAEQLNFPIDRTLVNLDRYGNTTAGTIPLVLDEAVAAGRIQRGQKLLVAGFGAGLGWGISVMTW